MLRRLTKAVPGAALALALALAVVGGAGSSRSQTLFEQLVMPGELTHAHRDLEKTCERCHASFDKSQQPALCLDCHKEIRADIAGRTGFHGRSEDVTGKVCKLCHTEHAGRGSDIAPFDEATFDHALTDYLLKGRHTKVACKDCHKPAVAFHKAPSACDSCHAKDDRHRGRLGADCAKCHDETGWRSVARFDHAKTAFPLEGAHRKVKCEACHAGERYAGTPKTCIGCHGKEDVHKGSLGKDCAACHGVASWKRVKFDHDRQTKFPLRGAHRKVDCARCHVGGVGKKIATTCVSCHVRDDVHKGALGPRCESCHGAASWRKSITFDHGKTRFPLRGLHREVGCKDCHKSGYAGTPTRCSACHADAVHKGRLGRACESCHSEKGWPFFRFDHDRNTRYPLTGAHRGLSCHACHKVAEPESLIVPTACIACHAADDVHQGAFGRRCERCHTTGSFKATGTSP